MKAIIHIGTQKTGTTTIQSFLAQNRASLSTQGLRFEPFTPRNIAQMELGLAGIVRSGGVLEVPNKLYAMGVRGKASQGAYVDRLETKLREGVQMWPEHTYIASSEQIHAWLASRKRIEAMHQFLTDIFTEVRYVVYYRPQEDFMLSTYSENIRRGEFGTLDDHINTLINRMNFNRRAQIWASVVGRENLTVRLFDRKAMLNGDLLDDFCSATGIDRSPLETPESQNLSLSAEEIDLRIELGRRIPARLKTGHPNPLFHALMAMKRRKLPKPGTRVQLSDQQRTRIRTANALSNEQMRAAFFPDRDTLF